MSLMGVRDLSLIRTAPQEPACRSRRSSSRRPTRSSQRAISTELDRGGQVYYVHNRIESIYGVARALEQLVPQGAHRGRPRPDAEARARADHGASSSTARSTCSSRRRSSRTGSTSPTSTRSSSTTPTSSGSRSSTSCAAASGARTIRRTAFLLYQAHKALTEEAKARLEAIREFTHLGSGLADRDARSRDSRRRQLARRGAVGLHRRGRLRNLRASCWPKRSPSARARSAALEEAREAVIDVKIDAFIPNDYIPQVSQKIAVYQQLASARTQERGRRDRGQRPRPLRPAARAAREPGRDHAAARARAARAA